MATIFVGSFHDRPQLLQFEPSTKALSLETLHEPEFAGHTWISASPTHADLFYAAQRETGKSGTLSLVKLSKHDDKHGLAILQTVPSGGTDPAHVGVSPNGDKLAIANYDSSTVATYALRIDGSIDETSGAVHDLEELEDFSSGPDAARQEAPHPHGCFYLPTTDDWLVPDLGSDKLRILGKGNLPCRKGAGPRHAAVHPNGQYVYAVNELDNTVTVHVLKSQAEPKTALSVLASDCKNGKGMNAAAILLTPDSRTLYVTNRLENHPEGDAIVWFSVSETGEGLQRKGELRTKLDHPRAAELFKCLDKDYLIVGSKTGMGAVIYERAHGTGDLKEVARNIEVIHPSCFAVLRA